MIPLSTLALGLIDKHAVQLQDILCSTLLYTVTLWRYKSVPFGWVLWKLLIEGKRTHQKSHETAKPPTLVYPVFTLLCSMLHCSSPLPITLPPFLKFCIYILLRCGSPSQSCYTATLRRRLLPSCSFALSPVWRIIKTHLQCCWSWPDLRTHTVFLSLHSL